ncbi:hypothetical protein KHC28_23340 [Ancylobacter sonchi]|uniref:hypothetical protein n=1 Tax=Ancylobacter sonchi TaxID=1937790 RepID=UPI001BD4A330|nr:hypothetical protein [Ancylobacter sonchi]MBS7536596.1 hypothetical protein [Ancylobacter sonchi]
MVQDVCNPSNIPSLRSCGWKMGMECLTCGHRAVLTVDELMKRSNVGEMGCLDEMARRARRGPCGGKSSRCQPIESATGAKEWV